MQQPHHPSHSVTDNIERHVPQPRSLPEPGCTKSAPCRESLAGGVEQPAWQTRRVAFDGVPYTYSQFEEFYGSHRADDRWEAATPERRCVTQQNKSYTWEEFVAHYGKERALLVWTSAAQRH